MPMFAVLIASAAADPRFFLVPPPLAGPALRPPVVEHVSVPGVVQSRFPAAVMDYGRGGSAAGDEVR